MVGVRAMRALKLLKAKTDCVLMISFAIAIWVALIAILLEKF